MKADFENQMLCLKELIGINSIKSEAKPNAPFGVGPAKALDYSLDMLQKLGFKTENLDYKCGYGEVGEGDLFGILGHVDVVPVDGEWHYDPFGCQIDDGRIYGRGTLDDKGPTLAAIFATARLLQEGFKPKKRIRIILGCDEESGWGCMDHYCKVAEMPVEGFSPDADFPLINCEKGLVNIDVVMPAPKDVIEFKAGLRINVVPDIATITVTYDKIMASLAKSNGIDVVVSDDGSKMKLTAHGKSAHGSTPEAGENAIVKLFGALGVRMRVFNELYSYLNASNGENLNIKLNDEQSGDLTMNVGLAEIKDGKLIVSLDIRHPISYTKEEVENRLKNTLVDANIVETFFHLPHYVDKNDPLVTTLLSAYNEITGDHGEAFAIGGGTYAKIIPKCVAFGPCFPNKEGRIHQTDEYIEVEDFKKITEIYYKAIKDLCF